MSDSLKEEELRTLLVRAMDGDASDAELLQLNEMLRDQEDLRRVAARFLCDDAFLAEEIGTIEEAVLFLKQPFSCSAAGVASSNGHGAFAEYEPNVATPRQDLVQPAGKISIFAAGRKQVRSAFQAVNSHGLAVTAAAILLAVGFGWHYLTMMAKFDRLYSLVAAPDPVEHERLRKGSRNAAMAAGSASVARVTGVVNCQWPDGEAELKFGDQLTPGQHLRLSRGLIQLTFDTGAKVVVEGPADFSTTAPTEAVLSHGKIAAAVPRFARGYTILTPTAEVVDLGTEFGVDVDQSGASQVHVFDGDVVARPRGEHGTGQIVHARQDEGVEFDPAAAARRISADRQKFVRRLTPDRSPDELPPLPVSKDLVLWLAADVMPALKEGDRVSTWQDILLGDNRFPDDAWQFDERLCPTWIRDGQGLPAVRFDGWSTFLATSPMATNDRVTSFVVFAPSPATFASESHGGMMLKFGLEAPSLEFALMPSHTPRARVWAANEDGSTSNVGVLQGPAIEPLVPSVAAYSYDTVENRAELLVNGKSVGTTTAPRPLEQHAKKYIGSHAQPWYEAYYLGNIYEIIVYNGALDATDRQRVFEYLSTRYGIALAK